MSQTILPALRPVDDVDTRLGALAEERILSPARRAGYELALLGVSVLPNEQMIVRSESGGWLLVDQQRDPTAVRYRGERKIPIPDVELTRLRALRRAGVWVDHLWLAHELPAGWAEEDGYEHLVPAPARLRAFDSCLERGIGTAVAGTRRAGASLAALADAVDLDPVLLAGVQHQEHRLVVWAVLAQWSWR